MYFNQTLSGNGFEKHTKMGKKNQNGQIKRNTENIFTGTKKLNPIEQDKKAYNIPQK